MSRIIPAGDLRPGDAFVYGEVATTVLGEPFVKKDIFGRDEWAAQCRREDTGAEGLVLWGLKALVEVHV